MELSLIEQNLNFIKNLPDWAKELSLKYLSKTTNLYIIHGNIFDLLPHQNHANEFTFGKIQNYIAEYIFESRHVILFFDRSSGITFLNLAMKDTYLNTLRKAYPQIDPSEFLSTNPLKAFYYIEKFVYRHASSHERIVLIVDYAETIVPNVDLGHLNEDDRTNYVTLQRWCRDPVFTQGDVSVILLTENLTDLLPRMVNSPGTFTVRVPLPDLDTRRAFLQFKNKSLKLRFDANSSLESMAVTTAGLNLMNLNQICELSVQENKPISVAYLQQRKKEMIENESGGLLEFLESPYNLSMVSGHEFVKRRFKNAAKAIKQGRLDVLPMGYLISGPVGTGKSFIVSAFTGEIGIPMVSFKNFRSKWQGVTESNLEKILNILRAMAPVGVMIDEADAFLGDRDQEGDSGTSNRIFAQIASFMGNTLYRGKIIWFLITCRPDLLPIDIKRQGRAEEHLALFYPETLEEKEDLFKVLVRKLDLKIRDFPITNLLKKFKHEFSGADLESILIRAKFHATMEGRTILTQQDLEQTLQDFVPPSYPHEIELQNLVAVLECTSREMVPARFQNLDRTRLIQQITELKTLLGEHL